MKNILITGGLGYIGTELCKLYSGESRYKNITVLDSRFVSERVKQLSDWGIKFVQGSILDEQLISNLLKEVDIVYHLAGITDVAYTKTESNDEKDREIRTHGIDGTMNIINHLPKTAKLFFPSTHVVFEGLSETKFDLDESEPVNCMLSYSTSKARSEKDIENANINYVIVRLGSVYGYSTDTMRINIMPNLFSKIASQNGTIKLFSGGKQYKSLVNSVDVARACKFLAESDYNKEIFHLSNENMTVKQIAEICKKYANDLEIIETNDEVPNLGYTLSNRKLLKTGFEFLYNIEDSIKEMIQNWTPKSKPTQLEYKLRGQKEFVDHRGKISNYELTEPINLIGYIESKTGTVRANHYHPIQEQKCLLVTGKYISVTKDLSDPNAVVETRLINAGDIAVIQPNVAHTMVFLEDSIFLNLVRGEREHENYGITHTIPYILVDEKMRKSLIKTYKTDCRSCGNNDLQDIISLGMSPLANNLISSIDDESKQYPLEIKVCTDCLNVQLSVVVPPSEMFDNYLYVSSTAQSFRKHFEDAAEKYVSKFKLTNEDLVVDIGSNDGVFLKPLVERNIRAIGVEPAKNLAKLANNNNLKTYNNYFDENVVKEIIKDFGKAKVITASNVFAHSDVLKEIATNVFDLLTDDGQFIIEVQYFIDTMNDLTFDNIYHEHTNYWTVTSLNNFFSKLGYHIHEVEHISTHGGSIRVYISRKSVKSESLEHFLKLEDKFGIHNLETYSRFAERVNEVKQKVNDNINWLKSQNLKLASYGSPAKATTSLNYFGVDHSKIEYTVEDNNLKFDKFIPGVNIPIKSKEYLLNNLPDVVIVLAWNFFETIKSSNTSLIERGIKFISIKDLQDQNFQNKFLSQDHFVK